MLHAHHGPVQGPDRLQPTTIPDPLYYNNTDLQVTLSNNTGIELVAKYKWQQWTLYGGYLYIRQQNPSDNYPNGFETIGYYNVPGQVPALATVPGEHSS